MILKEVTRELPCEIDEQKLQEHSKKLANLIVAQRQVKKEQSAAAAEARREINDLQKNIDQLANIVSTGREMREVECREEWNGNGKVDIIRLDTNEVTGVREPTPWRWAVRSGAALGHKIDFPPCSLPPRAFYRASYRRVNPKCQNQFQT